MQVGENTKLHTCIDQLRDEVTELSASNTEFQHLLSQSASTAANTQPAAVSPDEPDLSTTCPAGKRQRHPLRCVAGFAARLILAGGAVVCTSQLVSSLSLRQANRGLHLPHATVEVKDSHLPVARNLQHRTVRKHNE